jgi:hypothetical protein
MPSPLLRALRRVATGTSQAKGRIRREIIGANQSKNGKPASQAAGQAVWPPYLLTYDSEQ